MGVYQHAVQAEAHSVNGAMPPRFQAILNCAREYISRQDRLSHPAGAFDNAKRFSLAKKYPCCDDIRFPSRRYPYPEMTHGRSLQHVAHEFGLEHHLKIIRQAANRLNKYGLEDVETFLRSPKVMRQLLEADLTI